MAAIAAPVEPADVEHLEPFLGTCRVCSAVVLVVELEGGHDVALEPRELLEQHPCPLCESVRGRGHDRVDTCKRCRGTGYLGEPLPDFAIALDAEGVAHARLAVRRRRGEAMHRPHRCGHPSGTRTPAPVT